MKAARIARAPRKGYVNANGVIVEPPCGLDSPEARRERRDPAEELRWEMASAAAYERAHGPDGCEMRVSVEDPDWHEWDPGDEQ